MLLFIPLTLTGACSYFANTNFTHKAKKIFVKCLLYILSVLMVLYNVIFCNLSDLWSLNRYFLLHVTISKHCIQGPQHAHIIFMSYHVQSLQKRLCIFTFQGNRVIIQSFTNLFLIITNNFVTFHYSFVISTVNVYVVANFKAGRSGVKNETWLSWIQNCCFTSNFV